MGIRDVTRYRWALWPRVNLVSVHHNLHHFAKLPKVLRFAQYLQTISSASTQRKVHKLK